MSPRPDAGARLRRVLALVPWIAEHQDAHISEIAAAFGVTEDVIRHDLELLPLCGLPPYTPDRLIDVEFHDGYVRIRFAEYFRRPLRLSPDEGFALLAAGRALLDVPGSDPGGALATALAKLDAVLHAGEVLDVDVGAATTDDDLEVFRAAIADREQVEIDYWSYSRDAVTTRSVDPVRVFAEGGHWYVAAWCHTAGDERLFRLDRVRDIRRTGEHFEARDAATTDTFHPEPEHVRVTLDVPPSGRWLAEDVPVEDVQERPKGQLRVVLAVAAHPWLERLLLQLGPEAKVIEPKDLRDAGKRAAERLLARYQ